MDQEVYADSIELCIFHSLLLRENQLHSMKYTVTYNMQWPSSTLHNNSNTYVQAQTRETIYLLYYEVILVNFGTLVNFEDAKLNVAICATSMGFLPQITLMLSI